MKNTPLTSMKSTAGGRTHPVRNTVPVREETMMNQRKNRNAGRNGCPCRWHINRNQRCPRTGRKKSPMCCNRDGENKSGRPCYSWQRLHHPAGRCDCFVGNRPRGSAAAVGYHAPGRCFGRERGLVSDRRVGEINETQ